jgi:hypothetical protein
MKITSYHILGIQQNQIHGQSVPEIDGFLTLFLDNMAPACLLMDQIDNQILSFVLLSLCNLIYAAGHCDTTIFIKVATKGP